MPRGEGPTGQAPGPAVSLVRYPQQAGKPWRVSKGGHRWDSRLSGPLGTDSTSHLVSS